MYTIYIGCLAQAGLSLIVYTGFTGNRPRTVQRMQTLSDFTFRAQERYRYKIFFIMPENDSIIIWNTCDATYRPNHRWKQFVDSERLVLRKSTIKTSRLRIHKLFSSMIWTVGCIARISDYNRIIFWHYKKILISISFLSSKCKIGQCLQLTSKIGHIFSLK